VRLGQHVIIRASVNWTGRTSMEVGARLEREDPHSGERARVATAYMTFVAIDPSGKPQQVPALLPETEDEVRRMHEAELRRKSRLELKSGLGRKSLAG
jgi:acyl-CoA hydrolase